MKNDSSMTKSIYIVLSYNDTFVGKMIEKRAMLKFWNRYAGDRYTHASLSLDASLSSMMSFARKKVHNPLIAGMIKEDIRSGVFARSGAKSGMAVIKLNVTEGQYRQMQTLMDEFWARRDELKYDVWTLITMLLFARGLKIKNRYVCSHWVAEILDTCGVYHFKQKRLCDMRPFDYYDLFRENVIYEGLTVDWPEFMRKRA